MKNDIPVKVGSSRNFIHTYVFVRDRLLVRTAMERIVLPQAVYRHINTRLWHVSTKWSPSEPASIAKPFSMAVAPIVSELLVSFHTVIRSTSALSPSPLQTRAQVGLPLPLTFSLSRRTTSGACSFVSVPPKASIPLMIAPGLGTGHSLFDGSLGSFRSVADASSSTDVASFRLRRRGLDGSESANLTRGAGHGRRCGRATTAKLARRVPTKREDVDRERGCRCGGAIAGGRRLRNCGRR